MRFASIASLCAFLLSACSNPPTTLLLNVKVAPGDVAPASLLVSVYDRFGTLAALDERIKHAPPGKLVITDLPSIKQTIRIIMRGATNDGMRYGSAQIQTVPHRQPSQTITLSPTIVDTDGDDVPDDLDNCRNVPNPDQASESGMAPGNACPNMEMPDLVVPPEDDLTVAVDDMTAPPPDLVAQDLIGADFIIVPDLTPPPDLAGADLKPPADLAVSPPDLKVNAPPDMTVVTPSKCPGTGFLFCEDFETGTINTTRWDSSTKINATLAISTARSYRGTHSLRVDTLTNTADKQTGRLESSNALTPATSQFFVRYYVYREDTHLFFADMVEALPSAGSPGFQMAWSNQQASFLYYGGTDGTTNDNHTASETSSLRKIPAGVWTCIEWEVVYNAPGASQFFAWINDTDVSTADWDPVTTTVPLLDQLFVGVNTNDTVASTTYLDEIVLSTTRVGCAK